MTADPLMFIALLGAHFYFDYAGQGDFMAKAKNSAAPIPSVPASLVLWSHSAIHGAAAALITGLWPVFLLETLVHAYADWMKCHGVIGFKTDQAIHIACKALWFWWAWSVV